MLNKYGIVETAERKYVQLLKGLLRYRSQNPRIALFASFIAAEPHTEGNLELYLKALWFLTSNRWVPVAVCRAAVTKNTKDVGEVHLVPLARLLEFARRYFDSRMRRDDCAELRRKVRWRCDGSRLRD